MSRGHPLKLPLPVTKDNSEAVEREIDVFISKLQDQDGYLKEATFQCNRYCGACCKKLIVWVNEFDMRRIEALGYAREEFAEQDAKLGTDSFVLKKKAAAWECVFLSQDRDGRYACSIHDNRPSTCRKYPFFGKQTYDCRPMTLERPKGVRREL